MLGSRVQRYEDCQRNGNERAEVVVGVRIFMKLEQGPGPRQAGSALRRRLAAVAAAIALVAAMTVSSPANAAVDRLTQANLARVGVFTNWLQANHVPGVIDEVGWPGNRSATENRQWNSLATTVYKRLAQLGVPTDYWETGEKNAMLDPYEPGSGGQLVMLKSQAGPQRGINIGSGEHPGSPYPGIDLINKVAADGFTSVRLPFNWETLQPASMSALDESKVAKLQLTVRAILAAGMTVQIDNHNYARYNGRWTTPAQLSDFWKRLAPRFPDHRVSFGMMNEPFSTDFRPGVQRNLAADWEHISAATVTAIRHVGSTNLVTVSGFRWSNAYFWSCTHPKPWIVDPAKNYRYEAHTYFDRDTSGRYASPYANTSADSPSCAAVNNSAHPGPVPQPSGGPTPR